MRDLTNKKCDVSVTVTTNVRYGDGKKSLILRSENSLHDSIHVILRNAFDPAVCDSNKERKHAIHVHNHQKTKNFGTAAHLLVIV